MHPSSEEKGHSSSRNCHYCHENLKTSQLKIRAQNRLESNPWTICTNKTFILSKTWYFNNLSLARSPASLIIPFRGGGPPNTRNAVFTKHGTFRRYHIDHIGQGSNWKYSNYVYSAVIKTTSNKLQSKASKNKTVLWTTIISHKRMAEKRWCPRILELTIRRKWVVRVTYWTETSSPTGGVKAEVQAQCPIPGTQPVPSSPITELSLFILNGQSFKLVRHAHLLEAKLAAMFQKP